MPSTNYIGKVLTRIFLKQEQFRLEHITLTQGHDAALEFAKRTMVSYRRGVINKRHFASTPKYRRGYIESYLDFKKFISNNGF